MTVDKGGQLASGLIQHLNPTLTRIHPTPSRRSCDDLFFFLFVCESSYIVVIKPHCTEYVGGRGQGQRRDRTACR